MNNQIVDPIKFKEIKLFDKTVSGFRFLLLLLDGRLATIGEDDEIKVYDPKKDYQCVIKIKTGQDIINDICQLENGNIVTCGNNKLKIWTPNETKFKFVTVNKKLYLDNIIKVIPLTDNRLAIASFDGLIKILDMDPPYSREILQKDEFHINTILYLKKKNVLVSGGNDDTFRIWNLDTLECDSVLEVTECVHQNTLIELDEDRVMFGSFKAIVIINITEKKVDKIINNDTLDFIWTFIKLRDGNILVGNNDGLLSIYNLTTDEITPLKKNLQKRRNIYYLLNLNDHQFISCSQDLKIWEY